MIGFSISFAGFLGQLVIGVVRLGVEQKNYPMISRIIKDGIDSNLIKEADPENKNRRYVKYIPYWA